MIDFLIGLFPAFVVFAFTFIVLRYWPARTSNGTGWYVVSGQVKYEAFTSKMASKFLLEGLVSIPSGLWNDAYLVHEKNGVVDGEFRI